MNTEPTSKPYRLEARDDDGTAVWGVWYEHAGPAEAAFANSRVAIEEGRAVPHHLVLLHNGVLLREWPERGA